MKKGWVGLVFISFIFLSVFISESQEKGENPSELYDLSIEFYHQDKCEEAISGFLKIIESFPKSKLVPYSIYNIGLCYLKMEKFEEAQKQFELYLKAYPNGDRSKEAEKRIKIAEENLKKELESRTKEVKLLPGNQPVPEPKPSPEIKAPIGVKSAPEVKEVKTIKRRNCAQVFYFDFKDIQEVGKKLKELKGAGVDTLILRVFQNSGEKMYKFVKPSYEEGVYFKTEHAPVVEDILGPLTEIAHRHGLEVFAWMTTRYANYGLEGNSAYRCRGYNFETKRIEEARGANLFHPEVLKRLEGVFRDLGRYPIEGILIQDDLILKHNEDFNPEANQAFLKEFGYEPHPNRFYISPYKSSSGKYYVKAYTEDFWTWAKWKNRWLMQVAQQLMRAARESNPKLQFAINLYYEAVLNSQNGVAWFSQTLSEAFEKGFDYYTIMAYHRDAMKERKIDTGKAIGLMAEVAQKAIQLVGSPSQVMMKFQIYDWKAYEIVQQKEIEEILDRTLSHGKISLAFYPYLDPFPTNLLKGK